MMARAATDWLFDACHPAPASAFSTWTAKIPKTRTTRTHAMSTLRKWVAAHAPSRANGPGRPALDWVVVSTNAVPDPGRQVRHLGSRRHLR